MNDHSKPSACFFKDLDRIEKSFALQSVLNFRDHLITDAFLEVRRNVKETY